MCTLERSRDRSPKSQIGYFIIREGGDGDRRGYRGGGTETRVTERTQGVDLTAP